MRLFVAVELSREIHKNTAELVGKLRKYPIGQGINWVRDENLHITLKFLGQTPEENLKEIEAKIEAVSSRHGGFGLEIKQVGAFPSLKRPKVLWAGVMDPSGALGKVASDLQTALEEVGFPKENRPFNPHVTLARLKDSRSLQDWVKPVADTFFGRFEVQNLVLFESKTLPQGAVYTPVRHFALAKGLQ